MEDKDIDPVSGNSIPPGGTAEGVRDDIDAKLSEGEYIIPSNVVRFIGVEKLDKLVQKAREALGEDPSADEDDELPFDPSELESEEETVDSFDDDTLQMAEGGLVSETKLSEDSKFTGIKEYRNADGRVKYIAFMQGQPLEQPPAGYTEVNNDVTDKAPDPTEKVDTGQIISNKDDRQNETRPEVSPLSKDPSSWSYNDFMDFSKQKGSLGEKAIKGIVSMMPGGALAMKARTNYLDKQTAELMDEMVQTGVDPTGQQLSAEQRTQLSATREGMKKQMSDQSGLNLNPMESLGKAFGAFSDFISGNEQRASATQAATTGAFAPNSASAQIVSGQGNVTQGQGSSAPQGGTQRGTSNSYGAGSDLGRDNSQGPSSGSMASGGLYSKGGLVKRPKR